MSTTKSSKSDLKSRIRKELDSTIGNESTKLNELYKELITNKLSNERKKERKKWSTYNQVVVEFMNDNYIIKKKELQYRLTDNKMVNPKQVCLNTLEHVKNDNSEFSRLYNKIRKL